MKIETLKTSKRKYFLCALVVGAVLLITIVLTTSMAKYQTAESIKIAEGTINYKVPDLNLVAMYIENENGEYVETSSVPTSGYTLNSTSYCGQSDGNGNIIKDTSITIEYSDSKILIDNLTKKGTKCYLYFDVYVAPITTQDILAGLNKLGARSSFSSVLTTDPGGVYTAEDDDGTSYYFAGASTDNYVYFAGFYWRIIRINGDGSIRLIYDGTSAVANGTYSTATQTTTSAFNSSYDNNMYVGYMYTSGSVHGLGTASTVKGILDSWYDSNLASYASYIDTNAGFCGDRQPFTNTAGTTEGGGTGTTTTYYASYIRLRTNKTPSLKCTYSEDLYTLTSSSKGNKALTKPIGLITADEVAFAGGVYGTTNQNYYLYTGQYYWTLSPFLFYNGAAVWGVKSDGSIFTNSVDGSIGVRPVINLKTDTLFTGSGTSSDPYVVN